MREPAASWCGSDRPAPAAPCGPAGTSERPTGPAACSDGTRTMEDHKVREEKREREKL